MVNKINTPLASKNMRSVSFHGGKQKAARKVANVINDLPKGWDIDCNKLTTFLRKINRNVSSPEQRLIMGVTALGSQPFIDLNNKRVNEETRLMSFSRTLSKIIVGTAVGVLVRRGCIKFATNYSNLEPIVKKANKQTGNWAKRAAKKSFLAPDYVRTYTPEYHRNYINALGSILGIVVSLFTNFLIDAPLTQLMTNKIYKKINEKPSSCEEKNLLKIAMKGKQKAENTPKAVSFSGKNIQKIIEQAKKIHIKKHAKFVPTEGTDPIFHDFRRVKQFIWPKLAKDPGGMLMHTGAIGWAASSAAQITGIALNDKIDSNKKKFLIPQEFADASANIGLYYLVTISTKKFVESLFETGKIRIKSVMDRINKEAIKRQINLENIFKGDKEVSAYLENMPRAKNNYIAHKHGASILATLIASVISCNVLTPYLRNRFGAHIQEKAKEKSNETNTKLFNLYCQSNQAEKNKRTPLLFQNKFIV